MRVGFLFNHEGAHQVAHSLPIALALSRLRPDVAVELFHAGGEGEAEIRRLAAGTPHRCALTRLEIESPAGRLLRRIARDDVPIARIARLRDNAPRFAGLDALVVPEKTSLLLKSRFGLPGLRLIYTSHGAGDRAVGFDAATGRFDFSLLPGRKVRDRMLAGGLTAPGRHAVVGYAKFDTLADAATPRFFDNGRPTVLYNPHPSPRLSSWYRMGRAILDYFRASRDYNLIFAPHVMLFRKRLTIGLDPFGIARPGRIDPAWRAAPHMLIDTGSPASIDMRYALGADIYLGDASSQVYEFLIRPRPCIFANPRRLRWRGDPDFAHWRAGPVIEDIAGLDAALARRAEDVARYAPVQRAMFAETFDLTETPSSERAARAIVDWLDPPARRPRPTPRPAAASLRQREGEDRIRLALL
jgi:hypothetical protein